MLGTLCTLITALTCVSGVTVVTQKPVVTVRKGETASMDCNLGTVTGSDARWYKQIPGGVPQYGLRFYHSNSAPTYGSGLLRSKVHIYSSVYIKLSFDDQQYGGRRLSSLLLSHMGWLC
ncbi:hypothetical protein OYC64_006063 [Pagothenia borchgrevinki]